MSDREIRLRDAEGMASLLATMAEQLAGDRGDRPAPLCLVGIRSRGVPIAERIAELLSGRVGRQIPVGAIDITLYRDDIGQGDRWPVLRGTEVPFNVEGADVVLVDDVLFTGRTVRAALNAVCDLGRPARVRLAVVVDRGHREIPVQPDVVGLSIPTERREHVYVRVRPIDPVDEIVRVERA